MINVLVVDDHKIVRESLRLILLDSDVINVIAEAADGNIALDILKSTERPVNIVLTDKQMPIMDGITLTEHIAEKYPDVKVIMLSMVDDLREVTRAFAAGIRGYLLKSLQAQELMFCIQHVHQGNYYLVSSLVSEFLNLNTGKQKVGLPYFTDRERAILKLMSKGFNNTEIADQLIMGKRTVEAIRQDLLLKTGTKNSASLIYYAVSNRLL